MCTFLEFGTGSELAPTHERHYNRRHWELVSQYQLANDNYSLVMISSIWLDKMIQLYRKPVPDSRDEWTSGCSLPSHRHTESVHLNVQR